MHKNNSFYIRWKYEICKPPHASVSNSHFGYNAVIPAWMQESSHRDVKPKIYDRLRRNPKFAIHGRWISASLPK